MLPAIRSDARAISPPRPKSARCSANCSGCGRHRHGRRSVRPRSCGGSNSGPAAAPTPRFAALLPPLVRAAPVGAVFEWRPDAEIMRIAARVRDQGGAALIIDYGHLRSEAGDTFQAIARHSFADPLKNPGEA